ncbi:hypothetical protein LA66_11825 [Aureimonas altamirensis]|uniref:Uncharacterized protein n=1 Tax=Aureimonas altamirensis TaxID=370622 RepID=A0A0B1Q5S0_9HYPH|nr:hypothetical protein [Aureimonas altamirensis]KHJ54155.1 hypothetical protein LA66_11825 [Aureimonas altamirensis]
MLIPPAGDIAMAATVVGVLFLIRFLLTFRRIRAGEPRATTMWADLGQVTQPLAFGRAAEPDRRHAMRQFVVGAVLTACGLAIAGWVVASSVLAPIMQRGLDI